MIKKIALICLLCASPCAALWAQDDAPSFTDANIHIAVLAGDYDAVQSILAADPFLDLNSYNLIGFAPLHSAARAGRLDIADLLLDSGANINILTQTSLRVRDTALHIAARNGHLDMVALLIERGINPLLRDSSGNTALHDAEINGDSLVIMQVARAIDDLGIRSEFAISSSIFYQIPLTARQFYIEDADALYRLFVHLGFRHVFTFSPLFGLGYEIGFDTPAPTFVLVGVISPIPQSLQITVPLRILAQFTFEEWDIELYGEAALGNIQDITSRIFFGVGLQVGTPPIGIGNIYIEGAYLLPVAVTLADTISPSIPVWEDSVRLGVGYHLHL